MTMDEYRIRWDADTMNWDVAHMDRGFVGTVFANHGGRFHAHAVVESRGVQIASVWTFKAAVEQVIWYDRAMNQEVE